MKTMILILIFTLSGTLHGEETHISQRTYSEAQKLIERSLKKNVGYSLIESLTTEVGPRLAGTEAEARARTWAVKKLKGLGFRKVWVDDFKVKRWGRKTETAHIISPFPQPLSITTLGGSIGTDPKGVTAEVVRFKNLKELESAPLKGLKGKIVFVDEWMTRTQDGSGYSVAVKKRSGAAVEAGKRGAVAALIRSVGTDHHRFPHTGQMKYDEKFTKVPIAALSAPDADQLQRAMQKNTVKLKLKIEVTAGGELPSGNVIAEIPGRTDEIVIIGAHLDSWDLGTGAVDDGAGVGITVAAGKMILGLNKKPKRTIRIVLFGSEEVGIIGAKAYAKKYKKILKKHIVGTESDFGAGKIWRLDTRFDESKLGKAKELHKALRPLGISLGNNTAFGGPDMMPLAKAGVPVVALKQNGWDYFDYHHTADDTLDKINPKDIDQNVATYAAFTWMSANIKGGF